MDRKLQGILPQTMIQGATNSKADAKPAQEPRRATPSVEQAEEGILEINWLGDPAAILCVILDDDEVVRNFFFKSAKHFSSYLVSAKQFFCSDMIADCYVGLFMF